MTRLEIGEKINMLTVLEEDISTSKGAGKEGYYVCRCDCGRTVSKRKASLIHGIAVLTIDGISDTMANWAKRTNVNYQLIQARLSRGYSDKEAIYGRAQ